MLFCQFSFMSSKHNYTVQNISLFSGLNRKSMGILEKHMYGVKKYYNNNYYNSKLLTGLCLS